MVKAGCLFTAEQAAGWSRAALSGNSSLVITGADVDSRRCGAGCLFFALKGERVDGHDYVSAVIEGGACGAVVSESWAASEEGSAVIASRQGEVFFLVVSDTLRALQDIAAGYLSGISGPVRIGVTGSNGKTTTKELVASVLSERFSVLKTDGNFNSEIGLPLTVFNIKDEHDFAVIEMGINRVGEMDVLAEILRPDMVVITNIGTAHIGIFNNIETIAAEKRRAAYLFDGSGTLFVPEDEPFREFLGEGLKGKLVEYGQKSLEADYGAIECTDKGLEGWSLAVDGHAINFPLVGRHNLKNAFCAFSIGHFAGLSVGQIASGLEKAKPLFGRSEIIHDTVTIIQDCYNANLNSVTESMDFADRLEWNGRKHYIFGDMKELGADSASIHRQLGKAAAGCAADRVLFFGPDSAEAYRAAVDSVMKRCFYTEDYKALEAEVLKDLEPGDLILVKGSRSMNLERLIEPVKNKFGGTEC